MISFKYIEISRQPPYGVRVGPETSLVALSLCLTAWSLTVLGLVLIVRSSEL